MKLDINITISQEDIRELICKHIKENGYIVDPDSIEFVIEKNAKGFPPHSYEVLEVTSAKVKVDTNRKVKCLYATDNNYPKCIHLVDQKYCNNKNGCDCK